VLPGLLLSIGDTFESKPSSSSFLPEQSTHHLAEQTNICLQSNVRKEGRAYIAHLDAFIVALREELDTSGISLSAKNRTAKDRKPYRMDVKTDGTGIESTGWFRGNDESDDEEFSEHVNIAPRLCALEWVTILFQFVVPDSMKDEYAEEFISPMIRLLNDAPEVIVVKILEVLSKITVVATSEFDKSPSLSSTSSTNLLFQQAVNKERVTDEEEQTHPMTDTNANFALGVLDFAEKDRLSRNREVFAAMIHTHSLNPSLLSGLSRIIRHMCTLQPPEFIYVSFGMELHKFVSKLMSHRKKVLSTVAPNSKKARQEELRITKYLHFASKFAQVMINVLLTSNEAARCRLRLKDCVSKKERATENERTAQLFHILLKTFAHDCVAAISLCLWSGAYRTASSFLHTIDPLDLDLIFYLELDHLVEFIERPLFRDLHLKMLDCDEDPTQEGSSAMLYRLLKSILMILPQSTSYKLLEKRLLSVARFRQCAVRLEGMSNVEIRGTSAEVFVRRILEVRKIHCDAKWRSIRSESLEPASVMDYDGVDVNEGKRHWLGYANEDEERKKKEMYRNESKIRHVDRGLSKSYRSLKAVEEVIPPDDRNVAREENETKKESKENTDDGDDETKWKQYWAEATQKFKS